MQGAKNPAILKALGNLIISTITAFPPTRLASGLVTFSRNQQRQGFPTIGLAALAWVLEQLGANNDLVARNEALAIHVDGTPGRDNLLRELVKVNSYLCDCNPDVPRTDRLFGQVNQALAMHGRTADDNKFKKAFRAFNENCENDNISELSKMQDLHVQLYVWKTEARRHGQESLETVNKDIDHARFQSRIPMIRVTGKHFKWNEEDQKYNARDDADSVYILQLLQNPNSSDFNSTRAEPKPDVAHAGRDKQICTHLPQTKR